MKAIFRFLFLLFIFFISYQICNAQVVVTKNLTAGVNLIKADGGNQNINFSLTLPPGTASVTIELENSDTVNAISTYTISFSTQTWTFPLLVGNSYICTQNFGQAANPISQTSYSAQTLATLSQTFYSCPSSPTNKLGVKYTTTSSLGSLSVYAIVNTNGINLTTPPIVSVNANQNVQGIVAPNASLTVPAVINPVTIGGKNLSGGNSFIGVATNTDPGGSTYNTIPIGGTSLSATQSNYSGLVFPQDNNRGALAVGIMGALNDGTAFIHSAQVSTAQQNSANSNASGVFTTNSGYHKAVGPVGLTVSGQTFGLVTPPGFGSYSSCYITLEVTNTAGTAPTFDAFFQTSATGNTWTDRIHFAQVTTGTLNQFAGISGTSTGINPSTEQDRLLAVGTRVDGPIPQWMRFIVNITGGGSPNYNVTYGLDCT